MAAAILVSSPRAAAAPPAAPKARRLLLVVGGTLLSVAAGATAALPQKLVLPVVMTKAVEVRRISRSSTSALGLVVVETIFRLYSLFVLDVVVLDPGYRGEKTVK